MKKLLCLVLCLIMIIPASVSLAEGKIDRIVVTVTVPKAGTKASTAPIVKLDAGSHCQIVGTAWVADDFSTILPASTVFQGGKKYHILVLVTPDSGYQFNSSINFGTRNGILNNSINPFLYDANTLCYVIDTTVIADQVSASGGVYKLNHSKLTATLIKPADKNEKKLNVPNTVSANGKKYNVTEIKSGACKGMKKLTTLTLGTNVKKIGSQAFANCKKLNKSTIKNAKMAKSGFGSKCFSGIKSKASFKVPKSALKKYKDWIIKNAKAPKNSKIK